MGLFYQDINLVGNQLLNSRLQNITTAARIILGATLGLSDKGYQVFDTDLSSPYYWDGTAWVTSASPLPILTAGSVVFSNGLTLTEDNANFFWDDVNKFLGIGNNTPSYPLDVTGVIRGSSDALINGLTVGRGQNSLTYNTAVGELALSSITTGDFNSAFGSLSQRDTDTGTLNSSFGFASLLTNVDGLGNTAFGVNTLRDNSGAGNYNTAIGLNASLFQTAATGNTTIGNEALLNNRTGSYNVAVGYRAGRWYSGLNNLISVNNSILIGFHTKTLGDTQTNQIVIGYDATGLGSNTTIIGNSSTITTAVRGNLLLGTTTDAGQKLQVTGTAIISSTVTLSSLSGVGSRMVVADAVGELSTAAIPIGTVTSVGLSMPTAFTVTNSPVTGVGTLTVTGAGTASQYVRGDGALAAFPSSPSGGGSSIGYYLNGSVAASVVGYEQMSRTPVFGLGTNYTTSTDGLIAQFLTDVGDPGFLNIPGGAWLVDLYFNADSAGGSPDFYVELLKYDGATFTLLSTNVTTPEVITNGTAIDLYITSLSVPTTTLTLTDRLAIRVYVDCNGKTLTLHTENDNLSQVITTFSTGISTLNGLVAQVQYFGVGTTGTDFNISSATNTHTFNLPTASATNRGALSSTDWSTFNGKFTLPSLTAGSILFSNGTTIAQDNSNFFWDDTNNRLGIGIASPSDRIEINGNITDGGGVTITNSGTVKYRIGALGGVPDWGGQFINMKYNQVAGNWTADDVTKVGGFFKLDARAAFPEIAFYRQPIATNPRTDASIVPIAQFRLDTGNIRLVPISGNVQIGTTTDAGFKLDVNGTARFLGSSTFGTLGSGTGMFWDNTNNRLGIRTATPQVPLDVTGDIRSTTGIRGGNVAIGNYQAWSSLSNELTTNGGTLSLQYTGLGSIIVGSNATAAASAVLEVVSTTKGFLPPRMTLAQRDTIASPATGLQIYNTTTNTNDFYNGTAWTAIGAGGGGGASALFNYYNFT